MKYKVGDKVRIKSKAWYDAQEKDSDGDISIDYQYYFKVQMSDFLGLKAEIANVGYDTYQLSVDKGEWRWQDWMLEDSKPTKHIIPRRRLSKIGKTNY